MFQYYLAGDLNSDFARNTRFTNVVEKSLEDLSLKIFWQSYENPNIQPPD